MRVSDVRVRLVERDYEMMREIERWRCVLGRQVRLLAGFSGQRACDRRLKLLIESGYIERKRFLYGVPSLYFLTYSGKKLLGVSLKKESVKLEQILHDIHVLDCVIYFIYKHKIELNNIQSEKQLHQLDGFSNRNHRPDFTFKKEDKIFCVEVELTLKAKGRFEKNIKDNFLNYDYQTWVVPNSKVKIRQILDNQSSKYPNIEIIELEEVSSYVKSI